MHQGWEFQAAVSWWLHVLKLAALLRYVCKEWEKIVLPLPGLHFCKQMVSTTPPCLAKEPQQHDYLISRHCSAGSLLCNCWKAFNELARWISIALWFTSLSKGLLSACSVFLLTVNLISPQPTFEPHCLSASPFLYSAPVVFHSTSNSSSFVNHGFSLSLNIWSGTSPL